MKPPYVVITQNGRSDSYRLDPESDCVLSLRKKLFEYSVTNDAKNLPSGLFVLVSLPADIKTKIGRTHRNGVISDIDIIIDENWKFSLGTRTDEYCYYFDGKPVYFGRGKI